MVSCARFASKIAKRASLKLYPNWRLGVAETEKSWVLRLRKKIFETIKEPFVIRWLNELRIYIYPEEEISRSLFLTGYYEPNEFFLLNRILKPGMVFIDVGANIGLYTLFASKKVGRKGVIMAIEPSKREFKKLKANIELNKLINVRFLQVAISNYQGEVELLVATEEKSGHNTLGSFAYDSVALQGKERVRVERLDDIVHQIGLQRVDIVKVDIEGAEYSALQGAVNTLARFYPIILLELSDRTLVQQDGNSGQVWNFLVQNGYSIYVFDEQTGLPSLGVKKPYFDSENIIAIHKTSKVRFSISNQKHSSSKWR